MDNSFHAAHRKALKKLFDKKFAEHWPEFRYSRELDKESFLARGGLAYLSQEDEWFKSILIKTPTSGGEALFEPCISWAKTFDEMKKVSRHGDTVGHEYQIGDAGCIPMEQLRDSGWTAGRDRYFGVFSFSTRDWGAIDLMAGREIVYSLKEATDDVWPAFNCAWEHIDKHVRFFFENMDEFAGAKADRLDVAMKTLMVKMDVGK